MRRSDKAMCPGGYDNATFFLFWAAQLHVLHFELHLMVILSYECPECFYSSKAHFMYTNIHVHFFNIYITIYFPCKNYCRILVRH